MRSTIRTLIIMILLLIALTVNITKGSEDNIVLYDMYENALTEGKLGNYFDLSRGFPKYQFKNESNADVIELSRGYLYSKTELQSEFTLNVSVKMSGSGAQSAIDIGRKSGQVSSVAITFIESNNAIGIMNGSNKQYNLDYTGKIRTDEWYKLTLIAKGDTLHVYINDRYFTTVVSNDGFDGNFSFRFVTGNAMLLKDLSVFNTSSKLVSENGKYGELKGFSKYMLPGLDQQYTYIPATPFDEKIFVNIKDSKGNLYELLEVSPEDGKYTFSFIPRGSSGMQTIEFVKGNETAVCHIYLEAITVIDTKDNVFNSFYDNLVFTITSRNQKVQNIFGYNFKVHMSWLRDHIHMLKASVYWDQNVKDGISFWLNQQNDRGFFYEMFFENKSAGGASTIANSDPDFIKRIDADNSLGRFEIEADIEFMMVEAVYMVWQATGDDAWMKSTLANLDKGMTWTSTDSERWSKELGLTIRGSSIDCYDFTYGHNTANRRVVWWEKDMSWGTPMAVYHGDNTGFYQACKMLSEMFRVEGNNTRAEHYESLGNSVKANLIKTAWNGKYFAHMVQVHPKLEDLPKDWQEDLGGDWNRLSSGNAYALNRGFLTQEQASSIIKTFMNLRDNPPNIETVAGYSDEKVFAEWVTIYPSYRKKEYVKYDVDNYINGTIASFTAGELANGCFKYGFEDYGYDILTRLKKLFERDGSMQFFYKQNGDPYKYPDGSAGGPVGWGTATIQNAIIEGLAGFADKGIEFNKAALSPAWVVTEYDDVYASASYGASDNYISYRAVHNRNDKMIKYTIVGETTDTELKLLVPSGHSPKTVTVNGTQKDFQLQVQETSVYAVLSIGGISNTDVNTVEVYYVEGVPDIINDPEDKNVSKNKDMTVLLLVLEAVAAIAAVVTAFVIIKKRKNRG